MNAGGNMAQLIAIRISHLRRVTAHVRTILSAGDPAAPASLAREQQLQLLLDAEQALEALERMHRSIEAQHAQNQRSIDDMAARLATEIHPMWAMSLAYAEQSDQLRGQRRSNKRVRPTYEGETDTE
ncbi:hypothetical protein PHYSODRAFT_326029 [Phytophthora sojae]|uniref:Uncharacterized protein n=1 Tax=Phytophthora sojae (strain P6497) TaxID=1094619 RepID=G4YW96_PHYSP|nr:hypothetical protein PHYSODRAFT_326029 [Phytophthora sojae]EGZ24986.1 hypothetical protein PHYSODRAFT_326029 [Phytophthora sojae]|eukprot:XP_009520274.1 hypothetical protein PHYSODRAFT_326029 [Phytophthora sojae]